MPVGMSEWKSLTQHKNMKNVYYSFYPTYFPNLLTHLLPTKVGTCFNLPTTYLSTYLPT
jgi:hypothetical protein